jgi:hypothetical protein
VSSLVRRDRLESSCFPGLVSAGADRRGEERLGLGAAEDEVRAFTLRALLWAISSRRTTKAIGTARRRRS